MRIVFVLATLLAAMSCLKADAPVKVASDLSWRVDFDNATRFIFYSVMEGCYEDGVSNKDIDQILLRADNGKGGRLHFIGACPICDTTVAALEAYRTRPEYLFKGVLKGQKISTFGSGLPDAMKKRLSSPDQRVRLGGINELAQRWMSQRMERLNLSQSQRVALLADLEKKRQRGMDVLEQFRHGGPKVLASFAPGFVDIDECAVCNGAVGKPMKLPEEKPGHFINP